MKWSDTWAVTWTLKRYWPVILSPMLSFLLYSSCPLLLSQEWNVRSARRLCRAPSWTEGALAPGWGCRWTASLAAKPRMRVQYWMSSHQGAPCLLHCTGPKGRESIGATRCVRSATSSWTRPRRRRSTTTANPTRRDSNRSAMERFQVTQVGLEGCSAVHSVCSHLHNQIWMLNTG